mmetsp:Transcript_75981/g.211021  ORF Transcript_75981/g.211021 Transcript_75981/m.211021 type:complete len:249 (-) Transcript_75981:252-998(-)
MSSTAPATGASKSVSEKISYAGGENDASTKKGGGGRACCTSGRESCPSGVGEAVVCEDSLAKPHGRGMVSKIETGAATATDDEVGAALPVSGGGAQWSCRPWSATGLLRPTLCCDWAPPKQPASTSPEAWVMRRMCEKQGPLWTLSSGIGDGLLGVLGSIIRPFASSVRPPEEKSEANSGRAGQPPLADSADIVVAACKLLWQRWLAPSSACTAAPSCRGIAEPPHGTGICANVGMSSCLPTRVSCHA